MPANTFVPPATTKHCAHGRFTWACNACAPANLEEQYLEERRAYAWRHANATLKTFLVHGKWEGDLLIQPEMEMRQPPCATQFFFSRTTTPCWRWESRVSIVDRVKDAETKPGGYHVWCIGSGCPKFSGDYPARLSLVVATCSQFKEACETGLHPAGRAASQHINPAHVPIMVQNIAQSELAGVLRQIADQIRPGIDTLHTLTLRRLSWPLTQILACGVKSIWVANDTPNGLYQSELIICDARQGPGSKPPRIVLRR